MQHRVPGRLPGQHQLPRLPDAGRRGSLRRGLHPGPRPEPGRGHLRLRLLRPVREGLPPRGHRQAARHPRHEALPGRLALRQQHAGQRSSSGPPTGKSVGGHRRRAGRPHASPRSWPPTATRSTSTRRFPSGGGTTLIGVPAFRLPRDVIELDVNWVAKHGVRVPLQRRDRARHHPRPAARAPRRGRGGDRLHVPGRHERPRRGARRRHLRRRLPEARQPGPGAVGRRARGGRRRRLHGHGLVAHRAAPGRQDQHHRLPPRPGRDGRRRGGAARDPLRRACSSSSSPRRSRCWPTSTGKVNGHGLPAQCALGAPDASGRRSPEPIPGSEFTIPCDMVIPCTSQASDNNVLGEFGSKLNRHLGVTDTRTPVDGRLHLVSWRTPPLNGTTPTRAGRQQVQPAPVRAEPRLRRRSTRTPSRRTWMGSSPVGDFVTGPATIIEAAGRGRRTARAVDRWLLGVRGEELEELPVINRAVITQALEHDMPRSTRRSSASTSRWRRRSCGATSPAWSKSATTRAAPSPRASAACSATTTSTSTGRAVFCAGSAPTSAPRA